LANSQSIATPTTIAGKLRPNIVLLGFKQDWWALPESEWHLVEAYVEIIRDALEKEYGIGILRSVDGLDLSEVVRPATNKFTKIMCLGDVTREYPRCGCTEEVGKTDNHSPVRGKRGCSLSPCGIRRGSGKARRCRVDDQEIASPIELHTTSGK